MEDYSENFKRELDRLSYLYAKANTKSKKKNPKEFLSNFKTMLLEYKDIGMDAFLRFGITEENLLEGSILKRTLQECK